MASVLVPFTPERQQSAIAAGLSTFMVNPTTLDVFSNTDPSGLQTWMTANQITIPPTMLQMKSRLVKPVVHVSPNASNVSYFTMSQLRTIYNFPTPSSSNYVVGVVSFGGGLFGSVDSNGVLTNGDVQAYWTSIGIPTANQPKVIVVPVNGGSNAPSNNDGGMTMENTLDVETIGGACPSSNLTIILYITTNSLAQFPTLLNYMYSTNVTVNGVNYKPNLISCSWGAPEVYFTSSQLSSMNSILSTMTNAGINICVATGDNGSNDGVGGSSNYVDFPSSSPYSTAVGGTSLVCPNHVYDSSTVETAWSSGGGGVSSVYSKPSYQTSISGNYRSIPDVASLADPNTGVIYIVNGQTVQIGGTSVAAPTIAGLLACIHSTRFINPLLYQATYSTCFHDITSGSNGSYSARTGYDNCTGLGTVNGINLANAIATLTNPVTVSSITLSPTTLSLNPSQTSTLTATVSPSNATNPSLSWSSSNSSVATVSNGVVTAVAGGSATITALSTDGSNRSATATVTVSNMAVSVTGITILPTTLSLAPTQTLQLVATVTPSNATNKTLSWTSLNPSIATVSNGVVTAVAVGSATIRASSTDGSNVSATAVITVASASISVTGVSLSQTSATLHPTNTLALTATISPSNATNKSIAWSSNSANATVNSSGLVTAVSVGTATIKVTTLNGSFIATCLVTVTIPVSSVSVSPTMLSMDTGSTTALMATVLPSNAGNTAVTWSSSNPSVATVNSNGVVRAGSATGSTTITVQTVDLGLTATSVITVVQGVQSVSLNTSSISLIKGNTYQAIATVLPSTASNKSVTWISAMPSVATVSTSGLITAVNNGTNIITVVTQDGNRTASMIVRVTTPVASVSLNQLSISLARNATYTLMAMITPPTASNPSVLWSSSNSAIATVSSSGVVRGIAAGMAVISVTTVDGNYHAVCNVMVHS